MFSKYRAPGVYVEEVPSLVKAIAGVSTSTPGFIGMINLGVTNIIDQIGTGDSNNKKDFQLHNIPVDLNSVKVQVEGKDIPRSSLKVEKINSVVTVTFTGDAPKPGEKISAEYKYESQSADNFIDQPLSAMLIRNIRVDETNKKQFHLPNNYYPVVETSGIFKFQSDKENGNGMPATITNDNQKKVATLTFTDDPNQGEVIAGKYTPTFKITVPVGEAKLCTNFSEFKKYFGDFSSDPGQSILAHAVYGFFNNGGSRCFVTWVKDKDINGLDTALGNFEKVDEIAIVAVPTVPHEEVTNDEIRDKLVAHCRNTHYRFAIFDGPPTEDNLDNLIKIAAEDSKGKMPQKTDLAAWYFPWIKVFDPVTKQQNPNGDGLIAVPPSGHIAGIYARVDNDRGVFKAPANEVIVGAIDVTQPLSKAEQEGLNPLGVNCIRVLNKSILVWGARTVGGDDNFDLKYINVRRTLLFLRKSIDEGTQWAVFEPNTPSLWKKITRNVSDFLTNVWRSGALFGDTPQQAFYVKCDEETNPPELREVGQVVTEIGVAIVRPAEFVIFRISQITARTNG